MRAFVAIAEAQVATDKLPGARATLEQAKIVAGSIATSHLIDTRAKVLALAGIARAQARVADLPAAERWIQNLDSAWARCHCYMALGSLRFGES